MANLALSPVSQVQGGVLNLTSAMASTTGYTGVTFTNDGLSHLVFQNTAASPVALTIKIGSAVEGQAVASDTSKSVPANSVVEAGPFNADYSAAGFGGTVEIDFAGASTLTVALVHHAGTR